MDIELLDLLESQVDSLVAEMEVLRKENEKISENSSAGLAALTEENSGLKQALHEEQQMKDAVLQRVDRLLSRIQSVVPGE